jgi:type I restriction enzyme M protein
MKNAHPALRAVLEGPAREPSVECDRDPVILEQTTSLSLARALAVGCLSRLNPSTESVDIWDPAAGAGFAGFLLVDALRSAGIRVRYRGQDINQQAILTGRRRFEDVPDAELAVGDTLANDEFVDFEADLVIADAPWGMNWDSSAAAVESRQKRGAFHFGLPQKSDSTWLFISLALEKLRPAAQGGGRVAEPGRQPRPRGTPRGDQAAIPGLASESAPGRRHRRLDDPPPGGGHRGDVAPGRGVRVCR